ncbi:uncharacterized protein CDAR_382541 [Caerostris darwini]|uniref:Post-SET domain-containing protein n=1 Tax=Caerostris darwini TaxID=1538125 RepID=A0AAV4SQL2_9ARAC|nr:uncharacterized protein CDAR_382541 [Caerostris darwini]
MEPEANFQHMKILMVHCTNTVQRQSGNFLHLEPLLKGFKASLSTQNPKALYAAENSRCACGAMMCNHPVTVTQGLYRAHSVHSQASSQASADEHWSPTRHTAASQTDAFGTIEFQGSAHPLKAQVSLLIVICIQPAKQSNAS